MRILILALLTAFGGCAHETEVTLETSRASVSYRIDGGRARPWSLDPSLIRMSWRLAWPRALAPAYASSASAARRLRAFSLRKRRAHDGLAYG